MKIGDDIIYNRKYGRIIGKSYGRVTYDIKMHNEIVHHNVPPQQLTECCNAEVLEFQPCS